MGLGIDPTNDYAFRLAFGDPANSDLLIQLLNAILELPSPIVDVEILNPFIEREFETDKLAILDIKTIAIMYPRIPVGHLKFALSDLEYGLRLTDHFQIHTVELPKYNVHASDCPIGVCLEKWAWLFQRAEELDATELRTHLPEPAFQKLIGILEMISKTEAQRHIYESQQRAARDRAWQLKSARLEALATGREEGREEGEQLGIAKGQRIGQIQLLEQFLNEEQSDEKDLTVLTLAELDQCVANLQSRMHSPKEFVSD